MKPKNKNSSRDSANLVVFPPKIPSIRSNLQIRHRFRFRATAAIVAVGISDTQILGTFGNVCTVANSAVATLAKTWRLHSLEMWSPVVTNGTPITVSCELQVVNAPNREWSDTAISTTMPAHIKVRPPKDSLLSMWRIGASSTPFLLNCPTGTIVDLDVSFIMDDDSATLATVTVAAGTLGSYYYLALDGPTTNLLVPVSLQTTA